jgi:N-acetylmuramoyl-L-alanine amidase
MKRAIVHKGELNLFFAKSFNTQQVKHFVLSHPYREIYDFQNTRLAHKRVPLGLGSHVRMAQYKSNVVRVVISDIKGYKPTGYQPLFDAKKYCISLPHHTTTSKVKHSKSKLSSKKKPSRKLLHHDELIVIDAGHGGHDSGAVAGGKKEKDLVLQISKRVAKQLKRRGYRVVLTRTRDRFLKLPQRTRIADKKDATLFISIHANSVPKRKRYKVHGIETFFLQNTRDAKSQRIAARENKSVLKGAGSRLSKKVIIDSVLSGPKIVESNKLAISVQRRIMTNVHRYARDVKDGGVRHAPFWVLVGASRPSILVEVGYISYPKERRRLFNRNYQELISNGIAEGVDNYLTNRKKEIEID